MRVWTYLGILIAVLVAIFALVGQGGNFLLPLLAAAVVLVGVGSVTGQ